jgi:hypothetical protein
MGRHTLCEECNGWTGRWYGSAFADWTIQLQRYVDKLERGNELAVSFSIDPLKVIKQIATMALASSDFAPGYQRELRRFVRHPFEQFVPHGYRFFMYLNSPIADCQLPPNRLTGTAGILNVGGGGPHTLVMAEIAFPPAGYVILFADPHVPCEATRKGLCEITQFGNYRSGKSSVVWLTLRTRRPVGPCPLHYMECPHG